MTALAVFAAVGLLSWLLRIGLITLVPAGRLPLPAQRSLSYVAPAALAALPAMSLADAQPSASFGWPGLVAAALAVVVARRSKNLALTVLAGVLAFALLDLLA